MALCEVMIENDNDCYKGDYVEERNNLSIDIHDYSNFDSEIKYCNEIIYKSIIVKDYKNNFFAYSPIFYNTGSTYSLDSYESYKTSFYFSTSNIENTSEFNKNIKIKAITFYHPMLAKYFKNPCLNIEETKDYFQYKIKRTEINKNEININKNNISKIVMSGSCSVSNKDQHQSININTENYIKLYLINEITYEEVLEYIHEMHIYLNAYFPIALKSYETYITTSNNKELKLVHKHLGDIKHYNKIHYSIIKNSFFEFIEKMYLDVNYRVTQDKNKFLPLEFKIPTSLEDKFLFYFRYIDMYIGEKLSMKEKKKASNFRRIEYFIENNKDLFNESDLSNIYFANEINSLRNYYVHDGYYIPNNKFEVKNNKTKILYKKDMDYNWLFDITSALKFGVYKLMYKEILGLDIDESELKIVMNLI
ncbi:MAG: hypothetical protein MSH40_00840 [Christensenella sp.]|nr:hypothetical protein [Christensenella sp.]